MQANEAIALLRNEIRHHDKLYYALGTPTLLDNEYDELFKQLQVLEENNPELITPDSPTQRVGGGPVASFTPVTHAVPMLSIANAFDVDSLDAFHARVLKALGREPHYSVEWKIDGCALSLIYEKGVLVRAVTRGDGEVGDDVTHNARVMRGIPLRLDNAPRTLEVRGEAYIPNSVFKQVNARQKHANEELFKNSRNATAGAMRQLDPRECARRCVYFVAHGLGHCDPVFTSASCLTGMETLCQNGIPLIKDRAGGLVWHDVQARLQTMSAAIDQIDYPVDGIVVKVDDINDRAALGSTSARNVSWAMAYKWERYEAQTTITALSTQVGKQGTLTPVAFYAPVTIAETTVQKSTLFNFDEVHRLDPRVGDIVTLEKAGKIIPHLVRVHHELREGKPRKFNPPKKCPECRTPVAVDGVQVYCPNSTGCPAQLEAAILAAANRTRLDIDGLGPKAIRALIDAKAVTDLTSLWNLHTITHADNCIPGLTAGKSQKLLAAIAAARTRPSWKLMSALNIKHCGRTTSEVICRAIHAAAGQNVKDVFAAMRKTWRTSQLQTIEGVGVETAKSITAWLDCERNQVLLEKLRKYKLNMGKDDDVAVVNDAPQPLNGMTVCATGKLSEFTRDSIHDAIKQYGGKPASSVSKSTSLLVAGQDAGSKLAKAAKLGVRVVDEAGFKQLVGIA